MAASQICPTSSRPTVRMVVPSGENVPSMMPPGSPTVRSFAPVATSQIVPLGMTGLSSKVNSRDPSGDSAPPLSSSVSNRRTSCRVSTSQIPTAGGPSVRQRRQRRHGPTARPRTEAGHGGAAARPLELPDLGPRGRVPQHARRTVTRTREQQAAVRREGRRVDAFIGRQDMRHGLRRRHPRSWLCRRRCRRTAACRPATRPCRT